MNRDDDLTDHRDSHRDVDTGRGYRSLRRVARFR
jgi:hypothetical protein